MTKATDTQSEYVTLLPFPLQQGFGERACLNVYEATRARAHTHTHTHTVET